MSEIPSNLVEQIMQRRCVLFVGPDAAESAGGYRGLPTSWQLADELAERCGYRGQYRPLPHIAQIYQHTLSRHDLVSYLRQRLDDSAYQPLPVHELISRIPFAIIVHAGWDRLLERALDKQGVSYRLIQSVHDIPFVLSSENESLVLYKPYGSLDRPDTLVITEDDQLDIFYQLRALMRRLVDLIASYSLLMVAYAPDYDSVFVRIYHEMRHEQGPYRPPAFVVETLSRPEDAIQWEARGIRPLVTEPVPFLYDLAQAVAETEGRSLDLPDLAAISQAPAVTQDDLVAQTQALNRVLDTLGVGDLVEQTDVPLLTAAQVRDLEAMRTAYERLAESLVPASDSAQVWLRQGNIEYSRQNYDNARRYYELALDAQPELAEAYHNLHYVHLSQGHLDEALQAYQRAIALKPELALLPTRYRVDAVLGRGGIGVVYRALDQETGQVVAVKLLDRAYVRTERVVARFRREAAILQRLEHPHIVGYVDFQQYQGRYFLVMEYLGEQTLTHLLQQAGRLPLDQAYAIFQQACQAVSATHQFRIVHRDIKPANIFLVDGQVKLIDFGLAVDLEAGQPSVVGLATGTVAYMAPEQVAGDAVDERTDIYALASVFYEMITGYNPGQGARRALGEIVPGLNDALDIVLQKARERAPADRYPSVETFCQEVTRVLPLQPASRQAPLWLRALLSLQQGITLATETYWPLLLLTIGVAGLLAPVVLPQGLGRVISRAGGLILWDVLVLVIMADWFTVWLARRSGYASLAAYGPLLGALMGLSIGWFTHLSFIDQGSFDFAGEMNWVDYAINLMVHSMMAVIVGGFSFLAMAGGTRLALRLGLNPRVGAIGGCVLVLVVYALFLRAMFH